MQNIKIRLDYILLCFALALIARSFLLNSFIIFLGSYYIFFCLRQKIHVDSSFKPIIYSFILFFIYIVINSFFSTDINSALKSSISQIRFLLLFLFLIFLTELNKKKFTNSLNYLKLFIIFFCLDLIYQAFSGKNFFGFAPGGSDPARVSGMFGDELIAGTYLYYIAFPIIAQVIASFKDLEKDKKLLNILFILLISFSIILTGDRMATLLYFASLIIVLFYFLNFKKTILISLVLLGSIVILYFSISNFKNRVDQSVFDLKNIQTFSYYRLFSSSYNLWKENIIFGVGLKNYRKDCDVNIFDKNTNLNTLCSTHPHNNYLELLVETGIIGFSLYMLFIYNILRLIYKKFRINSNNFIYLKGYIIGLAITLLFFLWPIKSSGSMFTTFYMSFIWFNLGMLLSILYQKN